PDAADHARVCAVRPAPAARRGAARTRRRFLQRGASCRVREGASRHMTVNASTTTDRRRTERRAKRRPEPPAESWFGAIGVGEDTQASSGFDDAESRYDGGLAGAAAATPDSRFITRQARRIVSSGQTAFDRIYRV